MNTITLQATNYKPQGNSSLKGGVRRTEGVINQVLQVTASADYKSTLAMFVLLLFALFTTQRLAAQTTIPTFTNITPPNTTAMNFQKVYYKDSLNGFILSNRGHVIRTKDGGKTWNLQQKIQDSYLTDMYFISKDTAVIVGSKNIFKSNDGGETWYITQVLPLKDGSGNSYKGFNHVSFINKKVGFAYGTEIIWKTADGGNTWKEVLLEYDILMGYISSMNFTDANNGIAFAEKICFQTTNGGETWVKKYFPDTYSFSDSYFFTNLYGIASVIDAGGKSLTLKTIDGGNNWTTISSSGGGLNNWIFDKNIGFIGLSQSTFWKSIDSGKTWGAMLVPNNVYGVNIKSMSNATSKHICIVGEKGQIFDSYDSGLHWTRQSWGFPNGFGRLAFTDSLRGHVCAGDGKILNTTDGGASWKVSITKPGYGTDNVAFPTRDTGYVTGSYRLFRTINAGVTWDTCKTNIQFESTDFICFPTKDIGFMGVNFWGSVLRTFDGGKTGSEKDFFDMGIDDKALGGDFFDTQNGFMACNKAQFVRTNDAGENWERIDLPGGNSARTTHMFSVNIGVAFTPSGKIFRTIDNGTNWTQVLSKSEFFGYYYPIDANSGYVATDQADSVYYTKDQGLTWKKQNKGGVNWEHIHFVNPYLAYCSNSDGIYRVDFPRPGVVLLTASADSSVIHVTASKGSVLHVAIAPGQAMTAGNVYTVLLSDASGSFTNAVTIGSGTATGIDTITCTIPAGTASGTGYRIKVTSSSPAGATLVVASLQVLLAVPQVTLSIPLQKGWNLISTNVYPADSSIATLFAGKNVAEIKTQTTFWRSGQAVAYNSLTSLQAGTAYMVYMNAVDTLVVVGLPMKTLATSLQTGWNVVGCSYQTTTSFSTAVGTTTKIKDLKQLYQTTDSMVPGKGYFVKK